MVTIRRAAPADAAGIARVHDTSLRSQGQGHYSEEELNAMAPPNRDPAELDAGILEREDRYVIVAEKRGDIIGVGGVQLGEGRLLGVFVHPDWTGEGIGTVLLSDIEAHARDSGVETLTILSALNAVGFYESGGFERVGKTDEGGTGGPLGPYAGDGLEIQAIKLRKRL